MKKNDLHKAIRRTRSPEKRHELEEKKKLEEKIQKQKKLLNIIIALLGIIAVIIALIYFFPSKKTEEISTSSSVETVVNKPVVKKSGPIVSSTKIALEDLEEGKARFFDYKTKGGGLVKYFAVKAPSGEYKTALDACLSCYMNHEGYKQTGNEMTCNYCDQTVAINDIGNITGTCVPFELRSEVKDNFLVLSEEDMENGLIYF